MSYIGIPPFGQTVRTVTDITATAGQTTFNITGGYIVGYVDVFLNGAILAPSDFTATNGLTVVLASGAALNDEFKAISYQPVSLGAVNGSAVLDGTLPVGKISATGTPSSSTYLRGDGAWAAAGSAVDVQTFNASGTWTKPSSGTMARIQVWGGGGGGARVNVGGGGGGGGAYNELVVPLVDLSSTVSVTIGAGGTGSTANPGNGTTGGTSSFGSLCLAYGGGGGASGGTNSGGIGGGGGSHLGPGQISTAANTAEFNFNQFTDQYSILIGGLTPGGDGDAGSGLPMLNVPGYTGASASSFKKAFRGFTDAVFGGGGGSGTSNGPNPDGGNSVWGGAGGGGGTSSATEANRANGGKSVYGGNGGFGGRNGSGAAGNGTAPGGGGGGGYNTNGGNGAAGRVVVTVW